VIARQRQQAQAPRLPRGALETIARRQLRCGRLQAKFATTAVWP
jgi:hypothetical protein